MPSTHPPDFEHATHTAGIWLKAMSEALGTEDGHFAHRILRRLGHRHRSDQVRPPPSQASEHVWSGQLEAALEQLPHDIRALLLQPAA